MDLCALVAFAYMCSYQLSAQSLHQTPGRLNSHDTSDLHSGCCKYRNLQQQGSLISVQILDDSMNTGPCGASRMQRSDVRGGAVCGGPDPRGNNTDPGATVHCSLPGETGRDRHVLAPACLSFLET